MTTFTQSLKLGNYFQNCLNSIAIDHVALPKQRDNRLSSAHASSVCLSALSEEIAQPTVHLQKTILQT